MRVLRLPALAVVLALAYFAQYIFDNGTLSHFYPTWALDRLPFLARTALWLPEDLYTLGLWLLLACAILFGLLTPAWGAETGGQQPGAEPGPAPAPAATRAGHPQRRRLALGLILLGALLLCAWSWTALPVRIDPAAAQAGIQARALLAAGPGAWLGPGATGAPQLAYLPAALAMAVTGDALTGGMLAGLAAALLLLLGVWVLGRELFRTSPHAAGLALLGVGFTVAAPLIHFARLAPYLPATAAGVWAGALLLRGVRLQRAGMVLAAGALTGLALWFDRTGLLFVPLLGLWWLGLWLLPGVRKLGPGLALHPTPRLLGLWALGLAVVAAPLLLTWLTNPGALARYWAGGITAGVDPGAWTALRLSFTTFFWQPDAGPLAGYPGHLLVSLVAPLFVLSLGALLLSLDRLVGWCLLTWLGLGLILAATLNAPAPYWPSLLPLLPLAGLAITFALDRMAALWVQASHEQGGSAAAASLAGGLLIVAAIFAWVAWYPFARNGGTTLDYTARALRDLQPGQVAVLVSSAPDGAVRLDDPVLQFVAGSRARQALSVSAAAVPASLPPGSLLLVPGPDVGALAAVRGRFPQAPVDVQRDLAGNPRLFVVRLP